MRLHTVNECWDRRVVLKLIERSLQHVLRVDLLNTQQIQHHVVCQVKRTVQRISIALHFNILNTQLINIAATVKMISQVAMPESRQSDLEVNNLHFNQAEAV